MHIKEFKPGDIITRVAPTPHIGDRSYMATRVTLIGYENNVKLQWDTENISKTGIIGNPVNASASKGEKLSKITISTIEKIIKELKLL